MRSMRLNCKPCSSCSSTVRSMTVKAVSFVVSVAAWFLKWFLVSRHSDNGKKRKRGERFA